MRRIPVCALFLLAACSDDAAARAELSSPPLAAPGAAPEPPDQVDPRLFLDLDSLRWSEWEPRPPADRVARLRELGIVPLRRAECEDETGAEYDPCGERVDDFRFIDLTGDGVDDVVYEGPWFEAGEDGVSAREGIRLRAYQTIGGGAVPVMDHHGSVQRIWPGAPGEPVSFRTVHHGCCADPTWTIEYFRPVARGDTVGFEAYRRVLGRSGIEMPERFLAAPRRFTVGNDPYLLRAAPRIVEGDDDGMGEAWEGRGNALAEYGRGARGTAVADRTDDTGRVWWFVRMDGGTPPRAAQVTENAGDGGPAIPMDRLGWMSSRFLEAAP